MDHGLRCWRCGASLEAISLPLRRREECPACRAELHVCRLCVHFDCRLQRQCREDGAEEVRNKETANFCDWFRPSPRAFDAAGAAAGAAARQAANALFGGEDAPGAPDPARSAADALFGPPTGKGS